MSQIASSYAVTTEQLEQLASYASAKQYDKFWSVLHNDTPELSEFVTYSGYVVVVATLFLADREVTLPNNTTNAAAVALKETELAPLVLADPEEAHNAAIALDRVKATDEELRTYFEEFTGDEWDESAEAMRVSLAYLHAVLSEAAARQAWCLVHVG